MSGLKTIRRRITSVKNTKQITRAMKLVSAAKLRRAQEAAVNGREFRDRLGDVLATVLGEVSDSFEHPLLVTRPEVRKRRVIVVSGERGLCGAYNANVVKAIQTEESSWIAQGKAEFVTIGKQAGIAGRRFNWQCVPFEEALGEDAASWPVETLAEKLLLDYAEGHFDELVVYYTKFVSAMTQSVTREVILPFGSGLADQIGAEKTAGAEQRPRIARFDPAPEQILIRLLPLLLGTKLRQAGLEAKASEHAARMTAMDSATRNADDLIGQLKLFYNRARQSAITRELIDIVGGAQAVS